MQEIWDANAERWGDDVAFISVNERGAEDGVASINDSYPEAQLPVLQDIADVMAFYNSGASAYYYYVLDGERNVIYAHYRLTIEDADGEGQRAIDEIDAVLGR
jgi:hypothetical protein